MIPASMANMLMAANQVSIEYLGFASDATALTTYTFSSKNFGTNPSANRVIVVAVACESAAARTISSLTIGGVSATQIQFSSITNGSVGLYYANIPSASSGDIVVTWSGSALSCGIHWYEISNIASSTPSTSYVDTAAALSVSVTASADAAIVACAKNFSGSADTFTWGGTLGIVEDGDNRFGGSITFSSASLFTSGSVSALTVTATPGLADSGECLHVAVFN